MTKEEMIKELKKYLGGGKLDNYSSVNANRLMAMDLLASLKGYKTHMCQKQIPPNRKTNWK